MRRAATLVEVIVVAAISGVLVTVLFASLWMLNRASRTQTARIDARQQVRVAMAQVRAELQEAGYVYAGYTGQFAGHTYHVPAASAGNSVTAGDLLFAIPASSPPTGFLWRICGLRVVAHSPTDERNPNALDILEESVEGVGPAPSDDPAQLKSQLPSMAPLTTRRFAAFVDPSSYGVLIRPTPASVLMQFTFTVRPSDLAASSSTYTLHESYETEVYLRNQPNLQPSP